VGLPYEARQGARRPLLGQRLPQPDDPVFDIQVDRTRVGVRTPGPGLERDRAFPLIAVRQFCTQTRDTP
jgi:hypothetical protein